MEFELVVPALATPLREALEARPLCASCLGRLFAKMGTGFTNRERGEKALHQLGLEEAKECWLCQGLMEEIPHFADLVLDELSRWEFNTFLVGCRVDPDVLNREEHLWGLLGVTSYEPVKSEINREVGKRVEAALEETVDFERPDVTAVVDTMLDVVDVQASPLFIRGRYRKLARGIPQTRWPCRQCRGRGCERCNHTGKMYENSVEEVVAAPIMEATQGEAESFHGMGREDIDARMLGRGRPFILEVKRPRHRSLDLEKVTSVVNGTGLVEVTGLRPAVREEVSALKSSLFPKSYRLLARLEGERPLQKLNEAVRALSESEIVQRTPTRVAHRRADRERTRRVLEAKVVAVEDNTVEIHLRAEAGTYVKELVHGDDGRTTPSLAGLLGIPLEVVELDVLEIHDEEGHG